MNSRTEKLELHGSAGILEAARDVPEGAPRGIAVIAHPHPLFGGTMDHKVVQTVARAAVQAGFTALRFNFRGVGRSEGTHDEGRGETEDMLELIRQLAPAGPLVLGGFSFGAFVSTRVIERLWSIRDIRAIVLVGLAASNFTPLALPAESHERALVVHGEADDTVELAAVLDWARPQTLPVTVVPGAEHFFHGKLPVLKSLVLRHLR
ncbi:MAG TPA: alpha/beta fold hydrolase [Ramlibacter sp.]|uniref:alpha/beta hydrolase n=1 Tax=Ramlibacter sp. TaxID=1917967 RepID=UPI002BE860FE|nr:alpha/beta fold hydrolase [Ramlibacter sp.]HVZ43881.1 alpha/beta fold hydrolase [Ramlibacter sp.]